MIDNNEYEIQKINCEGMTYIEKLVKRLITCVAILNPDNRCVTLLFFGKYQEIRLF